jgi:acetylglutamate kinase
MPYLQRFRGKTIVIKYGGAAMKDPTLKERVVTDLVLLSTVGIRPVMVHGGGPEINIWLTKLGIEPVFKNGLRVTDGEPCAVRCRGGRPRGGSNLPSHLPLPPLARPLAGCAAETMDVVEMVLGARVNKSLVTLIQQSGGRAVGLCGKDDDMIVGRQMVERDIGFVGEVTAVNVSLIEDLAAGGYIPVVASVASDGAGQALNVNADTAAGEIAAALRAEKLILMTDVPGVLRDKDDAATKFAALSIRECKELVAEGVIAGGMIPKVDCCIRCLSQGVKATHIIDGRQPHSLLMELLTDEGVGTMITG